MSSTKVSEKSLDRFDMDYTIEHSRSLMRAIRSSRKASATNAKSVENDSYAQYEHAKFMFDRSLYENTMVPSRNVQRVVTNALTGPSSVTFDLTRPQSGSHDLALSHSTSLFRDMTRSLHNQSPTYTIRPRSVMSVPTRTALSRPSTVNSGRLSTTPSRAKLLNAIRLHQPTVPVTYKHDKVAQRLNQEGSVDQSERTDAYQWPATYYWTPFPHPKCRPFPANEPLMSSESTSSFSETGNERSVVSDIAEENGDKKESGPIVGNVDIKVTACADIEFLPVAASAAPEKHSGIDFHKAGRRRSSLRRGEKKQQRDRFSVSSIASEARHHVEQQMAHLSGTAAEMRAQIDSAVPDADADAVCLPSSPIADYSSSAATPSYTNATDAKLFAHSAISAAHAVSFGDARRVSSSSCAVGGKNEDALEAAALPDYVCASSASKSRHHETRMWWKRSSFTSGVKSVPIC